MSNMPLMDASHQELWDIITGEMNDAALSIHNLERDIRDGFIDPIQGTQQTLRLRVLIVELADCRRELLWEPEGAKT
jgi:hypothetical protein